MSNHTDTCDHCAHGWHGFPRTVTICNCPTAWTEPEGDVA